MVSGLLAVPFWIVERAHKSEQAEGPGGEAPPPVSSRLFLLAPVSLRSTLSAFQLGSRALSTIQKGTACSLHGKRPRHLREIPRKISESTALRLPGSLQNRRYLLRFSGERGQARGEREVRDTRDGRGMSRTSRSPRACPRLPEKRKKK